MIKVGERVPDFTAQTTDGRTIRMSELRGRYVVLYFFPKAFTTGCTIETKQFTEAYPDLRELGAEVIGVSADDHATQCDFARSVSAPFPMIGDSDRQVSDKLGVLWPLLGVARRVTFVIDKEGIVRGAFKHELLVGKHLEDAKTLLERLTQS